jgi:hypothetical protein
LGKRYLRWNVTQLFRKTKTKRITWLKKTFLD